MNFVKSHSDKYYLMGDPFVSLTACYKLKTKKNERGPFGEMNISKVPLESRRGTFWSSSFVVHVKV